MPSCAAFNCVNRQYKGCGKTFHRFPSKDSEKKLWLVKLKRENFFPSPRSVLCSDHFEASCFDRTGQTVRLKQNSLPTIFDFPAHLLTKKITPRKPILKKEMITEPSDCILTDVCNIPPVSTNVNNSSNEPSVSAANVSNFNNDHQYAIRDSQCTIKRKLDNTIDQMESLKKRLNILNKFQDGLKRSANPFPL